MMRFVKGAIRPFWRATGPVRRPLMGKLNEQMVQAVSGHVGPFQHEAREALGRIEESVRVGRLRAEHQAGETNLLLDSLVRELARLQRKLEDLEARLDQGEGTDVIEADGRFERKRQAG